jgi:mono/diheme cytochrome c family protein
VNRFTASVVFTFFAALGAYAWQKSPGALPPPDGKLIQQYCIGCHNDKMLTAGISFEGADPANVAKDAGLWEKALRKLEANQMPPASLPRPTEEKRRAFTAALEAALDRNAVENPNPGRSTVHRLNRNEYSNAIRDLLALDNQPGLELPVDDTGYGFDNIADVLSVSPVLIERYTSVARKVARVAVGDIDVKPVVDSWDGLYEVRSASRATSRLGRNERAGDDLPFDSVGGLSFRHTFPVDAEYMFRIKMSAPGGAFSETAPPVGQILELKTPVKAGIHHVGLTFMRSDAVAETVPGQNARGRGRGAGPAAIEHLDLRVDGARLKLYDVPEAPRGREIVQFEIAGPYNITGPGDSPSRKKIFICKPAAPQQEEPCARKILSSLARHAFRRPVVEADLTPLMNLYRAGRKDGSFDRGIESALQLVLVSPDFLFRAERDPAGAKPGTVHRVTDLELASRLSFFLWSSIPDEELLSIAERNQLRNPKILAQQVSRMLDDPKSKAFTSNFPGQWLMLRNLAQVKPDSDAYPEYDLSLRTAFQHETELFFNEIVRENHPVTDLLGARFTWVNQRLAEFYGIPGVYGSAFRRVELKDTNRGGILGQGSILTVTSYPSRTSVVQRGKWILENLLGTPPPPPPPNVPALELRSSERALTVREAMERHRANPVCASCHGRMDPLGFALENYNGIGEWREKDAGAPIDPSGKLPDGTAFQGPAGLRDLLLTRHREEFLSTFTEKLMTYALGRGLEPYDRPAVRAVMREAAKNNMTVVALIHSIVDSPQFQMRRIQE